MPTFSSVATDISTKSTITEEFQATKEIKILAPKNTGNGIRTPEVKCCSKLEYHSGLVVKNVNWDTHNIFNETQVEVEAA